MKVESASSIGAGSERGASRWWTIAAVCLATFMLIAFIMMLPIALPDLQRELGASFNTLQWVVDGYTLPLAALMLVAGAIADRVGRKRVFAAGLMLAIAAAAFALVAPGTGALLLACAALGTGAAMMAAASLALVAQAYAGAERTQAFGLWGTSIAFALAVGPLAGGFLVALAGWRGVFAPFIPVCAAALAITLARCEESRNPRLAGARLDWGGAVALCGALFALIYALTAVGGGNGWAPPVAGAASAILLVVFAMIELRLARDRRRPPILDPRVFLNLTLSGAAMVAATMAFANFGLTFYVTIFFANVQHDPPPVVGLKLLSITGSSVVASWVAGKLLKAISARWLLTAAMGMIVIGDILLAATISPATWLGLLPGFVMVGTGAGALNPPLGMVAVAAMRPEEAGIASGINNTFRQIGTALGIALLGALFQLSLAADLAGSIGTASPDVIALLASGRFDRAAALVSPAVAAGLLQHAPLAFAAGLRELFVLMAVVAAAGMAGAVWLIGPMQTRRRTW